MKEKTEEMSTSRPPQRTPLILHLLGSLFLRAVGWRLEGSPPDLKKYVVIIAPHTSHWDAFIWMALLFKLRLGLSWLAKSSLFVGPWGWVLKQLGGVPVHREGNGDLVAQAVEAFEAREHFVLGLAPEGTRSYQPFWRSGFYEIALRARIPVVPVSADYEKKLARVGTPVYLTGKISEDLKFFQHFYRDVRGKIRGRESLVVLRGNEEDS